MTQKQIYETALRQSAAELGCMPEDFFRNEPVITAAVSPPDARKYLKLPYPAYFVSYGSNIVASVSAPLRDIAADYLNRYPAAHCFEPPHLHMLHEALAPFGCGVSFTAEYWLPDLGALNPPDCAYEMRILTQKDFAGLYLPEWSNALCEKRAELDVLGVGAYDGERLVGFAGCSADCKEMWQIGVDVLPDYRRKGIAAAVTSTLAAEILKRDKVPFYCCAWCNLPSARNAIRSGFRPAWTEMQVCGLDKIAAMNADR